MLVSPAQSRGGGIAPPSVARHLDVGRNSCHVFGIVSLVSMGLEGKKVDLYYICLFGGCHS